MCSLVIIDVPNAGRIGLPPSLVDGLLFRAPTDLPRSVHKHIMHTFGFSMRTTNFADTTNYLSTVAPICMSNPDYNMQIVRSALAELMQFYQTEFRKSAPCTPQPDGPLIYLFRALHYNATGLLSTRDGEVKACLRSIIIEQIVNVMCEPEEYAAIDEPEDQLVQVFCESRITNWTDVFLDMDAEVQPKSEDDYDNYKMLATSVFDAMRSAMVDKSLLDLPFWILNTLEQMTAAETLYAWYWGEYDASRLVYRDVECPGKQGSAFQDTLIGDLLGIPVAPQSITWHEYCQLHSRHIARVSTLFTGLLASHPELWLNFIAGCLLNNADRCAMVPPFFLASSHFMYSLGHCLLRITDGMLETDDDAMLIDPTYCSPRHLKFRIRKLGKTSALRPPSRDFRRPTVSYALVTELFFLTHRALDLSFGQSWSSYRLYCGDPEQHVKLLACMQVMWYDRQHRDRLLRFYAATGRWLTQLAHRSIPFHEQHGYAPLHESRVQFPLPEVTDCRQPLRLDLVPVYIVCNIVDYVKFLGDYDCDTVRTHSAQMADLFVMLLALLDATRVPSPFMRSYMLQALSVLVANVKCPHQYSTDLVLVHEHRLQIAPIAVRLYNELDFHVPSNQSLMDFRIKVDVILIIHRLLAIPEHVAVLRQLADLRLGGLDSMARFMVIYLVDANYLLREIVEAKRAYLTVPSLLAAYPSDETTYREQDNKYEIQVRMSIFEVYLNKNDLFKYYMAAYAQCDTPIILLPAVLSTMQHLICALPTLFLDASMCARAARFVNFLFMNILTEYNGAAADSDWVSFFTICISLYEALSIHSNFTVAVALDRRFYTPRLFTVALGLLKRICRSGDTSSYENIADLSRRVLRERRLQLQCVRHAPAKYLDPISGELMRDPVRLADSNAFVDRLTTLRHMHPQPNHPFTGEFVNGTSLKPLKGLRQSVEMYIAYLARLSVGDNTSDEAHLSDFEMGNIEFLDDLICRILHMQIGAIEM